MFKRKKWADKDFSAEKMPHSRPEIFWDIYKNRLSTILLIGLVALLFTLPSTVVVALTNIKIYEANLSLAQGGMTEEVRFSTVANLINGKNLLLIPCFFAAFLGINGIFSIFRRLIWQEGLFFRHDFYKGVKDGFKSSLILSLLVGVVNYFTQYSLFFGGNDGFKGSLASALGIGGLILLLSTLPFVFAQNTVYNLKFAHSFKNGFLFAMRTAYITIPLILLHLAPFILLQFVGEIANLVLLILLPILVYPPVFLIDILYADSVLDKFVNKDNFPEIYRKGIFENAQD